MVLEFIVHMKCLHEVDSKDQTKKWLVFLGTMVQKRCAKTRYFQKM